LANKLLNSDFYAQFIAFLLKIQIKFNLFPGPLVELRVQTPGIKRLRQNVAQQAGGAFTVKAKCTGAQFHLFFSPTGTIGPLWDFKSDSHCFGRQLRINIVVINVLRHRDRRRLLTRYPHIANLTDNLQ